MVGSYLRKSKTRIPEEFENKEELKEYESIIAEIYYSYDKEDSNQCLGEINLYLIPKNIIGKKRKKHLHIYKEQNNLGGLELVEEAKMLLNPEGLIGIINQHFFKN